MRQRQKQEVSHEPLYGDTSDGGDNLPDKNDPVRTVQKRDKKPLYQESSVLHPIRLSDGHDDTGDTVLDILDDKRGSRACRGAHFGLDAKEPAGRSGGCMRDSFYSREIVDTVLVIVV